MMAILGADSGALAISNCNCAYDVVINAGLNATIIANPNRCLGMIFIGLHVLKYQFLTMLSFVAQRHDFNLYKACNCEQKIIIEQIY